MLCKIRYVSFYFIIGVLIFIISFCLYFCRSSLINFFEPIHNNIQEQAVIDGMKLEKLQISALEGVGSAQFQLGKIYKDGIGVPKDYTKAIGWFQKAAEQGLPDAQCSLGSMYASGYGVEQDYIKALDWYTQSAKQQFAIAQYNLGIMYHN